MFPQYPLCSTQTSKINSVSRKVLLFGNSVATNRRIIDGSQQNISRLAQAVRLVRLWPYYFLRVEIKRGSILIGVAIFQSDVSAKVRQTAGSSVCLIASIVSSLPFRNILLFGIDFQRIDFWRVESCLALFRPTRSTRISPCSANNQAKKGIDGQARKLESLYSFLHSLIN